MDYDARRGQLQKEAIFMYTFLISMILLVVGYIAMGKISGRIFGVDDKLVTPAIRLADGVDYVVMPGWKIFMIQLLNIAGLGPIFGAILGGMFGPVVFIWIVLGSIFVGSVHDYFSGMISLKYDGKNVPDIVGMFFGGLAKNFTLVFLMVLTVLVGVVFVKGPALILTELTGIEPTVWFYIIFIYYFVATIFPIDQIIGRIYPIFAIALIIMAIGLSFFMIFTGVKIPELSAATFYNMNPDASLYIFPTLFITLACGAVSGFHATQSPLMARCMERESQGQRIFYGAMITEAFIAIIWAAAAMSYFGGVEQLNAQMAAHKFNPSWLVNLICTSWLGKFGGALAVLGVVACPITTGDTAFRSGRLMIADFIGLDQKMAYDIISCPIGRIDGQCRAP